MGYAANFRLGPAGFLTMRAERSVAAAGLSPSQVTSLRVLLGVMTTMTEAQWSYNDSSTPSLVIVNRASLDGVVALKQYAGSETICVLLTDAETPTDHTSGLLQVALRANSLLDCLFEVERLLAAAVMPVSAPQQVGDAGAPLQILAQHLYGLSQIDGADNCLINIHDLPPLLVFPHLKSFSFNASLEQFTLLPVHAVVKTRKLPAQPSPNTPSPQPWNRLLWSVGSLAGDGKLLPWLASGEAFHLRRWPNFSGVLNRPYYNRLSAYLTRQAASLAAVERVTGISYAEIADFINACALCGYLHTTAPTAPAPRATATTPGSRSLFGKIRKKLNI